MEFYTYTNEAGIKMWFVNGKYHREDGPAVINENDGYKAWYINNNLHRIDGPARIYPSGNKEWWINGKNITNEVENWIRTQNVIWPWDEEIQVNFVLAFY